MALNKSSIIGITEDWRPNRHFDSYRIAVFKEKQKWISGKIDADLKAINAYLKINKLREAAAIEDEQFLKMKSALHLKYRDQYGLKEYATRVRVKYDNSLFDFGAALDLYTQHKAETTSIPMQHRRYMKDLWYPFFHEKGCRHPKDWKAWRSQAKMHIKTVKKVNSDKPYSMNTWVGLAGALNEFLCWCVQEGHLSENESFNINVAPTLEQLKRANATHRKNRDTYTRDDLYKIKLSIDETYRDDSQKKLRAYVLFFILCTGLRRGNGLGLKGCDLYPDEAIPHFSTRDNRVIGSGRGEKGVVTLTNSTKTSAEIVLLPLLQPDRATLCEVARFIKANTLPDDYILNCYPSTVGRWWKEISEECGFKYVTPHGWKHSYATIGAANFVGMYGGDSMRLHNCCLHEDFQTTLNYIDNKGQEFLKQFAIVNDE